MKYAHVAIAIACALVCAAPTGNPVDLVVVPNPVDLPVPVIRQKADNWCWLAVAEMVIYYKKWGLAPTQCEILEAGAGVEPGTCCDDPSNCDRPGALHDIRRAVEHYSRRRTQLAGPLPDSVLYRYLKREMPVIAAVRAPGAKLGHVVAIRGLRYVVKWLPAAKKGGPPRQVVVPYARINDPRGILTEEIPYPNLMAVWERSIVIE